MTTDRPAGDLGRKLREARERKGVSLRQIANSTKIAASVLEGLERNDISRLPGGIFGRAFVRAFASEIGLDPEAIIQEFIAQFPDDVVTAGHPQARHFEDREALESNRRMTSTFAWLILLSIPIAAVVVYFTTSGRQASSETVAAPSAQSAPPPASSAAPVRDPDAAGIDQPPDTRLAGAAAAGQLTVTIAVKRACWVSATIDGQKQISRTLQPGEPQRFVIRRELALTAGDAEAVTLTINGMPAKPLGRAGVVATIRVTPANFTDYLAVR
jgi:cytoskeletal protein RodZ